MINKIEDRLNYIMSIVLEICIDEIKEESSSDNIESWDSLRHMNLIIALEDEFDITIPDAEVGNMLTFGLILLIVNEAI